MRRRAFLEGSLAAGAGAAGVGWASKGVAAEREWNRVLAGPAVVAGPGAEGMVILQPVGAPATGFVELAVGDGELRRVEAEAEGLLPYAEHVLKFRLPKLPAGARVRYRVTVVPIDFQNAYKIIRGEAITTPERTFRTLDPAAAATRFAVWNDTHENQATIAAVHGLTQALAPDFLLWNGDQTNDVYDPAKMAGQYLAPGGLAIAGEWPLAYVRGNHDVRGPAARRLSEFTGTPGDRFYYAFRSGPVAALVLDTGEDKVDEHPVFGGLAAFAAMRDRQTRWLAAAVQSPELKTAPFKILFCHIPLWWVRESPAEGPWECAALCREAWGPILREAGVQLVVSGHTHEAKWLPAGAERPIGQLVGGGPKPAAATLIEGEATAERCLLVMRNLTGGVLERVELRAG
jgi:hypothetical protein